MLYLGTYLRYLYLSISILCDFKLLQYVSKGSIFIFTTQHLSDTLSYCQITFFIPFLFSERTADGNKLLAQIWHESSLLLRDNVILCVALVQLRNNNVSYKLKDEVLLLCQENSPCLKRDGVGGLKYERTCLQRPGKVLNFDV